MSSAAAEEEEKEEWKPPRFLPFKLDPKLKVPSWAPPSSPMQQGTFTEMSKALIWADTIPVGITTHAPVTDTSGAYYVIDAETFLWREIPRGVLEARVSELVGSPMLSDTKKPKTFRFKMSDIRDTLANIANWTRRDVFGDDHIVFACGTIAHVVGDRIVTEPLRPDHYARVALDVEYDPDWELPADSLLAQYLRSTFGDPGDRQRAAELLGAAIMGLGPRRKKAWFLVDGEEIDGRGGTGKSQLLEMLSGLVPGELRCSVTPQDFADPYHGAMLYGKRLNLVYEAPDTDILREEGVKAIVHGEPITRRPIRQAPITFRPQALHVFAANRLPDAPGATGAFWDRWEVLEFSRRFRDSGEAEVKNIGQQIVAKEYKHLVHLAIRGAEWLLEHGRYTQSDTSDTAKERWRKGADPVANFVAEWCEPLPVDEPKVNWSSASVLYAAYRDWCTARGHTRCSARRFGQRIPQEIERGKSRGLSRYRLRVLDQSERSMRDGIPDDEDEF